MIVRFFLIRDNLEVQENVSILGNFKRASSLKIRKFILIKLKVEIGFEKKNCPIWGLTFSHQNK